MVNKVMYKTLIFICISSNLSLLSSTHTNNQQSNKYSNDIKSNSNTSILNVKKNRPSAMPTRPHNESPTMYIDSNTTAKPSPNNSINKAVFIDTSDNESDESYSTNHLLGEKKVSFQDSQLSRSSSDAKSHFLSNKSSSRNSSNLSHFCGENSRNSYEISKKHELPNKHPRVSLCPKDLQYNISYMEHEEITCLSNTYSTQTKNDVSQKQDKKETTLSFPLIAGGTLLATGATTLAWYIFKNEKNPEFMSGEELEKYLQLRSSHQKRFVDPAATLGLGFKVASGIVSFIGLSYIYMKVKSFFISEIESKLEQEQKERKILNARVEAIQQDVQNIVTASNKHSKNLNENNQRFEHIKKRTEVLLSDLLAVNNTLDVLQKETENILTNVIKTINSTEEAFEKRDFILMKVYESKTKKIQGLDLTCFNNIPALDQNYKDFNGFNFDHAIVREFSDSLNQHRTSGSRPSVHQSIIPAQPKEKTCCPC